MLCVYIFFCLFISSVRKPGAGFLHTAPLVMKYERRNLSGGAELRAAEKNGKPTTQFPYLCFFFLYSSEQEKENIEKKKVRYILVLAGVVFVELPVRICTREHGNIHILRRIGLLSLHIDYFCLPYHMRGPEFMCH